MKKTIDKNNHYINMAIIILAVFVLILIGFYLFHLKDDKPPVITNPAVVSNPLEAIITKNTLNGIVNNTAVVKDGIKEFNEKYINYLLNAIGTSNIHKSNIGYGNPRIEILLDNEAWTSELTSNGVITSKGEGDDIDLKVTLSKEEAVKAILSSDSKQFMKDSISSKKTQFEMVAGKVELFSKGYLEMAKNLGYDLQI